MNALLSEQKQTRSAQRPLPRLIAGWAQVALFGWLICWGNHPHPQVHDTKVEYVAVGTARIDYSKSSPEQSGGRAERGRASQFLELVTTINGVRNWHVTGPDLDGRYGGLNGCGGVEAIYNQSTSSATYLLSDTYGHTEGTLSGTTFVWNPTQCDGYGALPGTTKPSALVAGGNVASQLGWRGHYIDPTGFYYMGARNYAPDSGTFLSPDPLGHSASMDLYSYCNGDPVNQYDADGRFGVGVKDGWNGSISSTDPNSAAFYAGNLLGSISGSLGQSAYSDASTALSPSTYVNGAKQFAGNINTVYQQDGLLNATSYALTSWNVSAIASGVLNVNLVNGAPVGDWEARTQSVLQGVSGTAGVVSAGVGLYSSLSSSASVAANSAPSVLTDSAFAFERTHGLSGNASSKTVQGIMDSMRTSGWQGDPISVFENNGSKYILDGHHRVQAAMRVGIDVPYINVPQNQLGQFGYQTAADVVRAASEAGTVKLRVR